MPRPIRVRSILLVWLVLLMLLSVSPLSFKLKLHTVGAYHNFGHYLAYALTGILLWLSAGRWMLKLSAFAFGVVLAFGQEWLENKIYHAGFEWKDVGTDLAGLVTGYSVMLLLLALTDDNRR